MVQSGLDQTREQRMRLGRPRLQLGVSLGGDEERVPLRIELDELDATVANMRFVKPIDRELIIGLAAEHSLLISVEENVLIGGAGAEVARVLEEINSPARLVRLGIPDRFIDHGDHAQLFTEIGLDVPGILKRIEEAYQPNS